MADMLEDVEDFFAEDNVNSRPTQPTRQQAPRAGGWGGGGSAKVLDGEEEVIRPFSPGGGDEVQGFDADDDNAGSNVAPTEQQAAAPKKDKAAALLDMMGKKAEEKGHRPTIFADTSRPPAASSARNTNGNQARQPAPATEYNTQGAAPPVISDSKIEFFRRRWLQTVLGGPRFLFAGDSKPPLSLLAAQILLWLMPIVVGVPCSILHCAAKDSCPDAAFSSPILAPVIAGGIYLLIYAVLQILRARFRERVGIEGSSTKPSVLVEEDHVQGSLFSSSGLAFLLPSRGVRGVVPAVAGACALGVAVHFLSPDLTQAAAASSSLSAASATLMAVGWLVLAVGLYSATAHAPPEPNRYHGDAAWGEGPLGSASRAGHVLLCMLPGTIDASLNYNSPWPRVALALLPVL